MLDLPFAARRLFDQTGKEHFSLRSLERDQVVYVTCGEPWSDPNLSKAEQQRRHLLANLNRDLDQIRQFVALRRANSESGFSFVSADWHQLETYGCLRFKWHHLL